jgi:hypothetical protein
MILKNCFGLFFLFVALPSLAGDSFCKEVRSNVVHYLSFHNTFLYPKSTSMARNVGEIRKIEENTKWTVRQKEFMKNVALELLDQPEPTEEYAKQLEEEFYRSCLATERKYKW